MNTQTINTRKFFYRFCRHLSSHRVLYRSFLVNEIHIAGKNYLCWKNVGKTANNLTKCYIHKVLPQSQNGYFQYFFQINFKIEYFQTL